MHRVFIVDDSVSRRRRELSILARALATGEVLIREQAQIENVTLTFPDAAECAPLVFLDNPKEPWRRGRPLR